MEKFFKIKERGSTFGREIVGGLTTFLAMAYIIAVNPSMLVQAGMTFEAALTATCFGAAIITILMGLLANRPLALASGMGINAIVTFTICMGMGEDWRVAMGVVVVEGVVILILVLAGLREAIMKAIPVDIRLAIGIGIGLFIAFIGLRGGGLIASSESTIVTVGDFTSPAGIVSIISILIAVILFAMNVPGSLLISIVAATIIGIPLGVTVIPTEWNFGLDFSAFAAPFQTDPNTGHMAIVRVFLEPALLMSAFMLLMSDFFDTMGTVVAVGKQGEFVDEEGNIDNMGTILAVDSIGAIVGGFLGASSLTTFVESTSGAAAGARTGLSSVFVGLLFIVFAFFSPIVGMVSGSATCGALTVVGFLMMTSIADINWSKIQYAFPAFITIIGIPFTNSITNGIGMGFISFVIIMVATGKIREVKPLMWVASAAFLVMFIFG
ncbi:MAG: NCS2 family permease [Coriobacteriales bacterium]|jgi:AGZA family xanthine/uracil permease-like MFS transporter